MLSNGFTALLSKQIRTWGIGKKLALGFAVVIAILIAQSALSSSLTYRSSREMSLVAKEYLPETQLAAGFERAILNARIFFIYHVTIQKPGALDSGWAQYGKARDLMPKLKAHVAASPGLAVLQQTTDQLERDLQSYDVSLNEILQCVAEHRNQGDDFKRMITEWARLGGRLVEMAAELNRKSMEFANVSTNNSAVELGSSGGRMFFFCMAGVAFAFAIGFRLTRTLSRRLSRAAMHLDKAASEISQASRDVTGSAMHLNEGVAEQTSSVASTAGSCSRIISKARENAQSALTMAEAMAQSQEATESGAEGLEQMVNAFRGVHESNKKVSRIIRVIDEIAFQTNILALNAAVEAARAGAAGAGFAVVADEVRNLARRSAEAARGTTETISQTLETTDAGAVHVERIAGTIREITGKNRHARMLADQVNSGSAEQAHDIDQITREVDRLRSINERVGAGASRGTHIAIHMEEQAARMKEIATDLNGLVRGEF